MATEAQKKATRKYEQKAYDKILLRVKAGDGDAIRQAAAQSGKSLNGFIVDAIHDKINKL